MINQSGKGTLPALPANRGGSALLHDCRRRSSMQLMLQLAQLLMCLHHRLFQLLVNILLLLTGRLRLIAEFFQLIDTIDDGLIVLRLLQLRARL